MVFCTTCTRAWAANRVCQALVTCKKSSFYCCPTLSLLMINWFSASESLEETSPPSQTICCSRRLCDGCEEVLPVLDSTTADTLGQRCRATALMSIELACASSRAASNRG
jgi:hypothetical protein